MKAFILYRPNSEFARRTEEYVHDFEATRSQTVELIDVDTLAGAAAAELYGAMDYPTLIIARDTGELVNQWQGINTFPLMNELAGYTFG